MIPTRQTIFVADHPKGRGNCMSACLASILELPLNQVINTTSDEVRDELGFYEGIRLWLGDRGLKMVTRYLDDDLRGVYSIGCGPSPRGPFHHSVVCKNGVMIFDPHPSDDGLLELHTHELLVPLTQAERRLHMACGGYAGALAEMRRTRIV